MRRWYFIVSALFLLLMTEALSFLDRMAYGEWEGKSGDKITQFMNLFLIATSFLLLRWGLRRAKRLEVGALLALAAVGFMLFSTLWSIDPQTTMRRGILYLFAVVGAIGMASTMEAADFMDVLEKTCALTAVASLVLLAVSPTNAQMHVDAGTSSGSFSVDFRGVFPHKNVLGQAMAAGAIASLHGMRSGGRGRMPHLVMLALFIIMGALSKSTTSLMVIFVFCGADIVIRLFRKGGAARTMAMVAVVFLVPTALFFAMFPDSLLELIGKDPTLTGRTELWAYVMADIGKKPFLGWGYSAFWSPNDPAAVEISTILMWYVPQAHNGLLEMLLNVGMIGSALFIFMWGRNIRLALRCLRSGQQAVAISALYACGGIFLFGISETVLMEPLQIGTTLFFVMGFMCEKAMRAARRKPFRTAFPTNRPLPA